MAKLAVLGVSCVPQTKYLALFLDRPVYWTSLPFPISIRAFHPVCPRAIFLSDGDFVPEQNLFKVHFVQNLTGNTLDFISLRVIFALDIDLQI